MSVLSSMYVSLQAEFITNMPHPVNKYSSTPPRQVLMSLLQIARIDSIFLLLLAYEHQSLHIKVHIDRLLHTLKLLQQVKIILLLDFLGTSEVELRCSLLIRILLLRDK